jgi:hypothetical protein
MNRFVQKYILVAALPLLLVLQVHASGSDSACLTNHVREAVDLNTERKELYHRHFGSSVSALFGKFIFIEKVMLSFTKGTDKRSTIYRQEGIPLFCRELAPIYRTPDFSVARPSADGKTSAFNRHQIQVFKKEISKLLKSESYPHYPQTRNYLLRQILLLEQTPNQQCLVRHFFESMAASLREIPHYDLEIKNKGMKSAQKLFLKHFESQLFALGFMAWFDRKALPHQLTGVGIFCQDIPPIDYR